MRTKRVARLGLVVAGGAMAATLSSAQPIKAPPAAGLRPWQRVPEKVVPDPGAVYAGLYRIGTLVEGYSEMTGASGGRTPGIVFTFHDWNKGGLLSEEPVLQTLRDPMEDDTISPLDYAEQISHDGSVLAIAWDAIGYFFEHPDYWTGGGVQPITYGEVFGGEFDEYIRTVAGQVKEFGKPIMLSPAAEFNSIGFASFGADGDQYILNAANDDLYSFYGDPTWPDGPERVRDLFRYVIDIFDEEGVENVTWFMYSHTGYMNPEELDESEKGLMFALHPFFYYPGDEYIDWIGTSAYVSNDDPALDLAYAIGAALDAFRLFTDKPYFIPEFGVIDAEGDSRAIRMRVLFDTEMPAFPDVRAWAFADAPLWAGYFDIPRLGNQPDEIPAWIESVWESGRYTNRIQTGRP